MLLYPSVVVGVEQSLLVSAKPISDAAHLPLLYAQRSAAKLLSAHVLSSARPSFHTALARLRVGEAVVATLQHQQQELNVALSSAKPPPPLFLDEYAESRACRLALWRALLCAPPAVTQQLLYASAVDRLVLMGALPVMRAFNLHTMRLPPSFLHFNGQMALLHEALEMTHAILQKATQQPAVFERLLKARLRRRRVLRTLHPLQLAAARRPR